MESDSLPFTLGISILPIECELHSIKLEMELLPATYDLEECLMHLQHLDKKHRDSSMAIEANR